MPKARIRPPLIIIPESPSEAEGWSRRSSSSSAPSTPHPIPQRNVKIEYSKPNTTTEIQGFVLYLSSLVLYFVFLAWTFTPDAMLECLGITYYPDKFWGIALSAAALMAIPATVLWGTLYTMIHTLPMEDLRCIKGTQWSSYGMIHGKTDEWSRTVRGDDLGDIDIDFVSKALHAR